MTQKDAFREEQSSKLETKKNGKLGGHVDKPNSDSLTSKSITVYQNGHPSEPCNLVDVELGKSYQRWNEFIQVLQQSVDVPVQKVFTIYGKRVGSFAELGTLDEVVVCGNEHFKVMPYGRDPPKSSEHLHKKSTHKTSIKGKMNKTERANLVKSCIVEPDDDVRIVPSKGLVKTLSEQDVTEMERSSKVRVRHSSPKPRPVSSAYQRMSMSSSGERKSIGLGGISRIPKRIVNTSPSCVQLGNNNNNHFQSTPIVSQNNNPMRPKKSDKMTTGDQSSKNDSSRNEFIRPRLVTVIRHGMRPRKAVRFLLNKKTARSYDQVLNELTESIKPDWGAVRKVYTLAGSEVAHLEDFFRSDDIFLACANDRLGTNDFDLDSEECKSIQPYVKASLGIKGSSRFKGLEPARSPNRRPKSCSNSQSHQITQYPSHPKYIPLAHFPGSILSKYYVGDIIGDGNFAVVRECTDRETKKRFALKVIDKAKCQGRDAPPEHEVKILSMVSHPNVVEMFEQYDFSNELYIVLELIEGGDLFDAIAAVTKFSEEDSVSMTRDIASALAFLHTLSIVHRDIKPENLLVYSQSNGQRRIKLGDFGLAKIADGPLYTICGTPTYVAPEILAESGYGLKVDIWALGVIVYVLLCGYPPFANPTGDQEKLFDLILSAEYDFPEEHWEFISEDAKNIIIRMIEPDTDMRLSAEEVLDHPWLGVSPKDTMDRRKRCQQKFNFRVFEEMGLKLKNPMELEPHSQS